MTGSALHRIGRKGGSLLRHRFLAAASLLAAFVAGCVAHIPKPTPMAPLKAGVIMTPGVRIVAEDASFTLEPHKRFVPPFRVAAPEWLVSDRLQGRDELAWAGCVLSRLEHQCLKHFPSLVDAWSAFERAGARRVRVHVGGRGAYFGLLYLGDAPPGSVGRSGKYYKIALPLDVMTRATIAPQVVFGGGIARGLGTVRTWILWIGPQPFRDHRLEDGTPLP